VGGAVMFFGASFVSFYYWEKDYVSRQYCTVLVIILFAVFITYGIYRSAIIDEKIGQDSHFFTVAALQGNTLVRPVETRNGWENKFKILLDAAQETIIRSNTKPDLIVLPEACFPLPFSEFCGSLVPVEEELPHVAEPYNRADELVASLQIPVLFGAAFYQYEDTLPPDRFVSALYFTPDNQESFIRYDKHILVKYGEYVPFSEYLPENFIQPISSKTDRGQHYAAMYLTTLSYKCCFTPNICIESFVPQYIRNQVVKLRYKGHDVRMLVNLSCDGWFRFSREIDLHLAANVFRAVENGLWHITAADCGLSAVIRPDGVITAVGNRKEVSVVAGKVYPDAVLSTINSPTIYQRFGDWYALLCAGIVFAAVLYRSSANNQSRARSKRTLRLLRARLGRSAGKQSVPLVVLLVSMLSVRNLPV
jgi:apolipoprotein N-acyltransferase